MKYEEYRQSTPINNLDPLPKSEATPCMRGVMDIDHYNRTGEIKMIEPFSELVIPENEEGTQAAVKREVRIWMRKINPNKPTKEVLEKYLRSGMTAAEIGEKCSSATITVYNWIKAYGLQGIKGMAKAKGELQEQVRDEKFYTDLEQGYIDDASQAEESPTLAGIEQPSQSGEEQAFSDAEITDDIPEADRPATIGELWEDAEAALVVLRNKYHEQADNDFRSQLAQLVLAVTRGGGV